MSTPPLRLILKLLQIPTMIFIAVCVFDITKLPHYCEFSKLAAVFLWIFLAAGGEGGSRLMACYEDNATNMDDGANSLLGFIGYFIGCFIGYLLSYLLLFL